jgi:tRNA(Arg) A34 adenosine deaminase TadA
MDSSELISRLLNVIKLDIAPKTREGVSKGNKLFGAAILLKSDLSLVIAETNNETKNPLLHGEVNTITELYARGAAVPDPKKCIFLATHEPCSLCLSAITWAGYDNFYYLFSHEDSRDSFGIPHDIRILKEVFDVSSPETKAREEDRPLYNRENAFWKSHNIVKMIDHGLEPKSAQEPLKAQVAEIVSLYADLSAVYQASKGAKGIPLA